LSFSQSKARQNSFVAAPRTDHHSHIPALPPGRGAFQGVHVSNASSLWSVEQPLRLLASRDPRSGALRFPACAAASPLAAGQESVAIENRGRLYSFTVIHPNPKSGAQPFALGYVDLPGPVRIFGRVRGDVAIGAICVAAPDAEFGYAFHTVSN
jgi:uncharacterized OB-fold protein